MNDMTWFLVEYWSAILFVSLLFVAIGFIIGVLYQNSRARAKVAEARAECSRQISRAFSEGRDQGAREATPKHGAHGRFVSKKAELGH